MPSLIEEFLGTVRRGAPNERRDCIDDRLQAFLGLPQFTENVQVTINSSMRDSGHCFHRDRSKRGTSIS
jgi:hypothetical protein